MAIGLSGLTMAFTDFSSSDLKKQALPDGPFDMHSGEPERHIAAGIRGATDYRFRLAFLFAATAVLWGAIFEAARLIFSA